MVCNFLIVGHKNNCIIFVTDRVILLNPNWIVVPAEDSIVLLFFFMWLMCKVLAP